jgi:hypothetical protein
LRFVVAPNWRCTRLISVLPAQGKFPYPIQAELASLDRSKDGAADCATRRREHLHLALKTVIFQ